MTSNVRGLGIYKLYPQKENQLEVSDMHPSRPQKKLNLEINGIRIYGVGVQGGLGSSELQPKEFNKGLR